MTLKEKRQRMQQRDKARKRGHGKQVRYREMYARQRRRSAERLAAALLDVMEHQHLHTCFQCGEMLQCGTHHVHGVKP